MIPEICVLLALQVSAQEIQLVREKSALWEKAEDLLKWFASKFGKFVPLLIQGALVNAQ